VTVRCKHHSANRFPHHSVRATERAQLMPGLTSALLDMLNLDAGVVNGDGLSGAQSKVQSAYDSYLQGKGSCNTRKFGAQLDDRKTVCRLENSIGRNEIETP
jgi:hypothetical protein